MLEIDTIRVMSNFSELSAIALTFDIDFDNNQNYRENKKALRNLVLSHEHKLVRTIYFTPSDLRYVNPVIYTYIEEIITDDLNEEDGILVNASEIRILDIEYYIQDNSLQLYLGKVNKNAYFKSENQLIKIDDLIVYMQINGSLELIKATFYHKLTFTKYFIVYFNSNNIKNLKIYKDYMGDYLFKVLNKNHLSNQLQQVTDINTLLKVLNKLDIVIH